MPTLLLLYGTLLFVMFVALLVRHPAVALVALLPLIVFRGVGVPEIPLAQVAGATLYLADGLFAAVACATLIELFLRNGSLSIYGWPFLLLATAVILSVARGLLIYDLQRVANESRSFFYFLSGLAFVLIVLRERLTGTDMIRLAAGLSLAATALALVRIAYRGIGTSQGVVLSTGEYVDARAVDAATALLIAQGLWLLPALARATSRRWFARVTPLVAVVVTVLQHRSVWVATAVGLLASLVSSSSVRRSLLAKAPLLIGLVGLLAVVLAAGGLQGSVSEIVASSQGAVAQRSTFTGRVDGWRVLLADPRVQGPVARIFGLPSGTGYAREVGGQIINYQPHNFYVQLVLRGGLLAVIALLVLLGRGLMRYSPASRQNSAAGLGLLITLMVFFITYGPVAEQGVTLGMALLLLAAREDCADKGRPESRSLLTAGPH